MHLPIPSAKQVQEFRGLLSREFGVELSDADAFDLAARAMGIYYVQRYYGIGPHGAKEDQEPPTAGERTDSPGPVTG